MGLQRAVMDGLLNSVFTPDFICPTAECRWPHIETIAVCSQCVDVTAKSNETCVCYVGTTTTTTKSCDNWKEQFDSRKDCTYTAPSGFSLTKSVLSGDLQEIPPTDLALWSLAWNGEFTGSQDTATLTSITFLKLPNYPSTLANKTLTECHLNVCRKTLFDTRLMNGSIHTQRTEEATIDPSIFYYVDPNYYSDSKGLTAYSENVIKEVPLATYLSALFTIQQTSANNPVQDILWNTTDIPGKMLNVSVSLTNAMSTVNLMTASNGLVYQAMTHIHVRWAWLVLPIVVVLMANIFLLVLILQSSRHRMQPWKSSLYPLIFFKVEGLDPPDAVATEAEDLKRTAKKTRINLVIDGSDEGIRFVKD